jgi:hypothetical protein
LIDQDPNILVDLVNGKTPEQWLELMNIAFPAKLVKFLSYLVDKTFFLKVWLKSVDLPCPIDVRLISNVKGFFEAYIAETAFVKNMQVGQLALELGVMGERETRRGCIILTNCWLLAAGYDRENGTFVKPHAPLVRLPQVTCEAIARRQSHNQFECPLFKSLPAREMALQSDFQRVDGEVENLIRYVEIDSTVPESTNVANGVAIICHNVERFSDDR